MQYFISAENSSYFYWQLELLIESFLMHGLEDKLVIGLAENNDQKIKGFSSNLVRYGQKFIHYNEGKEKDYLPLNRVVAIRHAIATKMLKPPFAMIHADMILRNPILISEEDEKYGIIVNNYEEITENEKEKIIKKTNEKRLELAKERNIEEEIIPKFPSLSFPIIFNSQSEYVWEIFFANWQANIEKLLEENGKDFPCERTALEITLTESFQHCPIKGSFLSASLLYENSDINLIHYKTGIPPVFHKKFYKYNEGLFHIGQNPYEILMENNPTVNTDYMQKVIKSYSKKFKRQFQTL